MRTLTSALCVLSFALLSMVGSANTLTVGSSGETYATITDGLYNAFPGDTVLVSSGTYNEKVYANGKTNVTVQAAPGAVITVNAPAGEKALEIYTCTGLTIKGDSPANRIKLVNNGGPFCIDGEYWGTNNDITYENLEIAGSAGGASFSVQVSHKATFINCLWSAPGRCVQLAQRDNPTEPITFNDCQFNPPSADFGILHEASCPLVFNRCTFNIPGCNAAVTFNGDYNGFNQTASITATDCDSSGSNFFFDDYFTAISGTPNTKTVELINPKLTSGAGLLQLYKGNVKATLRGKSAAEKADLRLSSAAHAMVTLRQGEIKFTDVITNYGVNTGTTVIVAEDAAAAKIELERCLVTSGSQFQFAGANTPAVTFTADNTIFEHVGMREFINSASTASDSIALTHCTFFASADGASATYLTNGANDSIVAKYCIFNAPGKTVTTLGLAAGSVLNIVYPDATVFGGALPADTIIGDPKLGADGHLTVDSALAGQKAVGSTATVDFDGQARPLGGTVPDIGADEALNVPVELSGFSVE